MYTTYQVITITLTWMAASFTWASILSKRMNDYMAIVCWSLVVGLAIGYAGSANAYNQSHCGPDGFSPPAPPEMCRHEVPEPSTLPLAALATFTTVIYSRRRHRA